MQVLPAIRAICLLLAALLASGCLLQVPLLSGADQRELSLETLMPAKHRWTEDKILLIPINGALSAEADTDGFLAEPSTLVQVKDVLRQAERRDDIRGVVLRIDSPGGTVTASDLIYREIQQFRSRKQIPVLAQCMDLTASGGYYVAMAATEVWALPTSVVGSIGVVATFPSIEGLGQKIGVHVEIIKSGEHKDIGSFWRRMSGEERRLLQEIIDHFHDVFVKVVDTNRPNLSTEQVRALATGMIYSAEQARQLGLIDHVGYPDAAFAKAKALAGVEDAALVAYHYPGKARKHFYARQDRTAPQATEGTVLEFRLRESDLSWGAAPFHYLWLP